MGLVRSRGVTRADSSHPGYTTVYLRAVPPLVLTYEVIPLWSVRTIPPVSMRVAVFGLGYVGTVSSACLAANGHDVWGVDPDELKVAAVSAGHSPVLEPGLQSLVAQRCRSGQLHATTRPEEALENADVSLLCVGTPSSASGESNLGYIYRVVEDIIESLGRDRFPHRRDPEHGATRNGRGRRRDTAGRLLRTQEPTSPSQCAPSSSEKVRGLPTSMLPRTP